MAYAHYVLQWAQPAVAPDGSGSRHLNPSALVAGDIPTNFELAASAARNRLRNVGGDEWVVVGVGEVSLTLSVAAGLADHRGPSFA